MKIQQENKLSPIEQIRIIRHEKAVRKARSSHLQFMKHSWMKRTVFTPGFHTKKICERIDKALVDFRNGESTYLLINVHHRSGKSDIVSRYLGPHFLGEFPTEEVMQVSYQANLAIAFSAFARGVFRSEPFCELYPDIDISQETNKKNEWIIVDRSGNETGGKLYATGLEHGLTGNGYALGILDDYCGSRNDAESETIRNNTWESFSNDFMTRIAPVGIVIVLATQWHWDDVSGRIEKAMADDPEFPKFEIMRFPARKEDYAGEGEYPGDYLFLERFSEEWYRTQYSVLGKYASMALLDCAPMPRGGGRLSTAGIVYENKAPHILRFQHWRVWDLAHTAKQRSKDDPDYTSGTLLGFEKRDGDPVPHLWIVHVYRTREGATKRDEEIKAIVNNDTAYVTQGVEKSIDSKDAAEYLQKAIPAVKWVVIQVIGDKSTRATPLEPIFDSVGHVHVVRGDWNKAWLDEVMKFDGSGKGHDDQIDNMSAGYKQIMGKPQTISNETAKQMAARRARGR